MWKNIISKLEGYLLVMWRDILSMFGTYHVDYCNVGHLPTSEISFSHFIVLYQLLIALIITYDSRPQSRPVRCDKFIPMETDALRCCISTHDSSRTEEIRPTGMEHSLRVQPSRFLFKCSVYSEPSGWHWPEEGSLVEHSALHVGRSAVWGQGYWWLR